MQNSHLEILLRWGARLCPQSFANKLTDAADVASSQTTFENHWPNYSNLIVQEAESQREKVIHP